MRRRFNRTQRNYLIVGLCAILVIMGVGYAAFSSQLKITGTSNIDSTWSVKIISITPTDIIGEAKDKPEITDYTDTTATFGTSLKLPNDSITYNIVIENQGSLDAKLDTISKTDTNNSAISFETSGVEEGDLLRAGENVTMKVKVTYTPGDSQPTNLESNLKVELEYSQAPNGYEPPVTGPTMGGQNVELVESGDGLYEDSYEAGRYIYRGSNPNNYITFNGETWRIIAKEADGTYKIIRNKVLEKRPFDNQNRTASSTYCTDTDGCGVYAAVSGEFSSPSGSQSGTVTEDSSIKIYLNDDYYVNNIDETAKGQMTSHSFNIGAVENLDQSGAEADSIEKNITGEKMYQWTGNVGLANVSDILRASTNPLCTSATTSYSDYDACNSNYLLNRGAASSLEYWTINAFSDESVGSSYSAWCGNEFSAFASSFAKLGSHHASVSYDAPRPVVFLKSDTTLSGSGTSDDPFTIV